MYSQQALNIACMHTLMYSQVCYPEKAPNARCQAPGNAEEHKRQETLTINPNLCCASADVMMRRVYGVCALSGYASCVLSLC